MDEKTRELLTFLKGLVITRGELAQKHGLLLDSLLLRIDERDLSKASDANKVRIHASMEKLSWP